MKNYKGWEGFIPGKWCSDEVNVRDFIQNNYTPYEGDSSFLAPATEATKKLWQEEKVRKSYKNRRLISFNFVSRSAKKNGAQRAAMPRFIPM